MIELPRQLVWTRSLSTIFGLVIVVGVWQLAGTLSWGGRSLPSATAVVDFALQPNNLQLLLAATADTIQSAGIGYLLGIGGAFLAAIVARLSAGSARSIGQANALINAMPLIALGPVFTIAVGAEAAPIAIAALSCSFPFYVSASSGFAAVPRHLDDLAIAFGAKPRTKLARIDLPFAMPHLATGLKAAAPGAMIGAIVGEWFGASRGLGLLIISAMQNFQIPLLWAAVSATLIFSLVAFAILSILELLAERHFS